MVLQFVLVAPDVERQPHAFCVLVLCGGGISNSQMRIVWIEKESNYFRLVNSTHICPEGHEGGLFLKYGKTIRI